MNLADIPFRETRYPGVSIHFYHRDEATRNAAVMIRMEAGCSYPAHRHRGTEELLVLQGGYRDERGEHREGDYVRYEDGSEHHPVALEGGVACVFFGVSAEGIDLLGDGGLKD